jgi:hypothetical protein
MNCLIVQRMIARNALFATHRFVGGAGPTSEHVDVPWVKGGTVLAVIRRDPSSRTSRSTRQRGLIGVALTLIVTALFAPLAQATEWSAPRTVWVEPSGHTIDGLFLDTWRTQPALLGQPITEELTAKVPLAKNKKAELTVQYFENLAIAYSPNDPRGADWTIQALPLGSDALKNDQKMLSKFKLADSGTCATLTATDCRRFGETNHTVRWGLKAFWEANGGEPMMGMPLTEEFVNSDGWTTQYFERAVLLWKQDAGVKAKPIGKEAAKRLKLTMKKVSQPVDVPVYDEALFQPPIGIGGMLGSGPGPIQGGYKEIVVSISQEAMWAYEDGALVVSSLVSTGVADSPETVTPTGYFSVLVKYDVQTMDGIINDEYYNVPDVPWVMYFDNNGDALHGAYWHNNFGAPMSHGCINLPLDVAEFLYGWAPEGTPVTVID